MRKRLQGLCPGCRRDSASLTIRYAGGEAAGAAGEAAEEAVLPTTCPICRSPSVYSLPVPCPGRAILSDGRVLAKDLAKYGCRQCGATFHPSPPTEVEVDAFYDTDYLLPTSSPASDQARAFRYAAWIGTAVGSLSKARVLETGCGSGALLRALADQYPGMRGVGLDPAAVPEGTASPAPLSFRRGRIGDLPADDVRFDLVYAVNVVEHVSQRERFLTDIAGRMNKGGRIVLICPTAEPPNLELLFFDHLTTFTGPALAIVAGRSGLTIAAHHAAPPGVGDFQLTVLRSAQDEPEHPLQSIDPGLEERRIRYLKAWCDLERRLEILTSGAVALRMFGAAQTAALLRAYAPAIWERVELLTLDPPLENWPLDRKIVPYDRLAPDPARPVVLAVPPESQQAVTARLRRDGHVPIAWNGLIDVD